MNRPLSERISAAVTVDAVVWRYRDEQLQLVLIKRKKVPFLGCWALPGGFLEGREAAEDAVRRELMEETAIAGVLLEQFYCFTAVDRDPRGRVLSIAYLALVQDERDLVAASDASEAQWWAYNNLPALAFDHAEIIGRAYSKLRANFRSGAAAFQLLPAYFTLSQLQTIYELVLGRSLDKRNFRKKVQSYAFIRVTDQKTSGQKYRPAQLYEFDAGIFEREGGTFQL